MSALHISRVGQIAINAQDLERAVAFYRHVLGLTLLMQAPGMAFFDCGGQQLMLAKPSKLEFDHPSSILYFEVPDVRAAHDELVSRDVTIEAPPFKVHEKDGQELWMTFFRDPEENVHALTCSYPAAS